MERIQGYARIPSTGAPAPGCTITVYQAATVQLAAIYSDNLAAPTPKANSFLADANGYFSFYAPAGLYDIQFSGTGIAAPYSWPDVASGLGDGGIRTFSSTSLLPTPGVLHRGRLALLTDSAPGLWVQDQDAWKPALDYALRTYVQAALPAAGQAGRVRRISDGPGGLVLDNGVAWDPVMAYGVPSTTKLGLPGPGSPGRLRRVTNDVRGVWLDTGTLWAPTNGGVANVVEFGARGDGATDDRAAIQAALDAGAGCVVLPRGTYAIAGPLTLPDGVTVLGAGATILAHSSFSGDSFLRAARRDDNLVANTDRVRVVGLTLSLSGLLGAAAFAMIDLCGLRHSRFEHLLLQGPGAAIAGRTALRFANLNPAGTSSKACAVNSISGIRVQNFSTFCLVACTVSGRCDDNELRNFRGDPCQTGFDFSGVTSGLAVNLLITSGTVVGDGATAAGSAVAATSPIPLRTRFSRVRQLTFGDGVGAFVAEARKDEWALGTSGTSAASPISQGGSTPENFLGSAYVRVVAGTNLAAGLNTYTYTFTSAPTTDATFLLQVVSGLPGNLTLQGQLSGSTFTLTVAPAAGVVLAADLVIRVVQLGG